MSAPITRETLDLILGGIIALFLLYLAFGFWAVYKHKTATIAGVMRDFVYKQMDRPRGIKAYWLDFWVVTIAIVTALKAGLVYTTIGLGIAWLLIVALIVFSRSMRDKVITGKPD